MQKAMTMREGDKLIRVSVDTDEAIIDFADILGACEVVPDETMSEAPWENSDGWEHEAIPASVFQERYPDADIEAMQGYCWDRGNRQRVVIVLGDEARDGWGAGALGASRGVKAEIVAQVRKQALEQLCKWYENGWEWWGVTCEFKGERDSLWGIDDSAFAETDVAPDVASNVAHSLEQQGYEVINRPERTGHKYNCTLDQWRDELHRRLQEQSWK